MTNAERIKSIEDREKAASPGPWEAKEQGSVSNEYWSVRAPSPFKAFDCPETILVMQWPGHSAEELAQAEKLTEDTTNFIAHSRADIPFLLSRIRALEGVLEKAEKALNHFAETDCDGAHELPRNASVYGFEKAREALAAIRGAKEQGGL